MTVGHPSWVSMPFYRCTASSHVFPWLMTRVCLLVSVVFVRPGCVRRINTLGDFQDSDPDKFDRAKLVEVLTAPYIEDSKDGIVALDPHALKKLFTTTSSLLQASLLASVVARSLKKSRNRKKRATDETAGLRGESKVPIPHTLPRCWWNVFVFSSGRVEKNTESVSCLAFIVPSGAQSRQRDDTDLWFARSCGTLAL